MDSFDIESFEDEKPRDSLLAKLELPDSQSTADSFDDKLGDSFAPSSKAANFDSPFEAKGQNLLFSLDEDEDTSLSSTSAQAGSSALDNLQRLAEDGVHTSTSLFDDLLDFSSPKMLKMDETSQNDVTDPKPVSNVDLLFGVDDDRVSPPDLSPEAVGKNPDILDFVDVPFDLPEVSSMDAFDNLTSEPLSNDWNLVSEVFPARPGKEHSPDIVVTTSSSLDTDLDTNDHTDSRKEQEAEEKVDESVKEEAAIAEDSGNRTDNNRGNTDSQDIDFSVLMLPEGAHLNFDHSKHKRNLSQKGSIANRKKPKRATIQPNSEDSIFIDSTEPRPHNLQTESKQDSILSSDQSSVEKTDENDSKSSDEASPSRKFAAGIKIPGLLEGLSRSKTFNKAERKSPDTEQTKSPEATSPTSGSGIEKSQNVSLTLTSDSPPAIRAKPVVLPRVLPRQTTKSLKETQNQNAASEGLPKASTFRNMGSAPASFEQPSLSVKSATGLSRSASVKVPSVSANKEVEPSPLKEPKPHLFGGSSLLPSKPDLKKRPDPISPKPVTKTPPPVAAKPAVAAKPSGIGLRMSASFSGGRSPLLPTLRPADITESFNTVEHKLDLSVPSKTGKSSEPNSVIKTEQKPLSHLQNIDNKPVLPGFTAVSKPLSFTKKNMDLHPLLTDTEKLDTNVETAKSGPGDAENQKVTVNRFPSFKKAEPRGLLARTEIKSTAVEAKTAESFDVDDVFSTSSNDKLSTLGGVLDSTALDKTPKNTDAGGEISPPRKSSFSGITSVKSPSAGEKPSSAQPRKGSISGSAYNPIGFRSALGSSDSDPKSRGSSFTGSVDSAEPVASFINPSPTVTDSSPEQRGDSSFGAEQQRSKDGSLSSQADVQIKHSPGKSFENSPGKTDTETLLGKTPTHGLTPKGSEDNKKELASETFKDVQMRNRGLRESMSPNTLNGSSESSKAGIAGDRRSSPWNIQLKKVEKKESSPKPEPVSKEDLQPGNWRQQLTGRPKSAIIPKETDKPKQDSTPEWAKSSIMRRQRLIDSGVIKGDSKKASDVF